MVNRFLVMAKIKIISATVVKSEQTDGNGNSLYDVVLSIRAMNAPQKRYSFRVFGCASIDEANDTAEYYKTTDGAAEEMGLSVVPVTGYLHKDNNDEWVAGTLHILVSSIVENYSQQERITYLIEQELIMKAKTSKKVDFIDDEFAEMTRAQLKAYITENELDITIKPTDNDDFIRKAIREALS